MLEGNVPRDGAFALFLHPLPGENANTRGLARGGGGGGGERLEICYGRVDRENNDYQLLL